MLSIIALGWIITQIHLRVQLLKSKLFLLFFIVFSSAIYSQSGYQVESFSPQGLIKSPKQVSVRFSQDMIGLGDPREKSQVFESNCSNLGTSRWLDSRNWVFEFKEALEGGIECKFNISSSLQSLSGGKLLGDREFSFSTGGINISYSSPWNGGTVEESPAFLLNLDGDVDLKSVEKEAYFLSENLTGKIDIKIITGSLKQDIVKAAYWQNLNQDRIIVVTPRTNFPSDSNIQLVWSKDISSKMGVKNDKNQIFSYKVRPRFQASFFCERENAKKDCIPITTLELRFSSSVPKKYYSDIELKSSSGKKWKASLSDYESNSNSFDTVYFKGPFPEKTDFTIHIPTSIEDDSGRNLDNISSFPLNVKTDEYPPLAKFAAEFGILESKASPILPVTVRNLEAKTTGRLLSLNGFDMNSTNLKKWLLAISSHDRDKTIFKENNPNIRNLEIPKTLMDGSMEVVGIPLIKPGLYVVEIESKKLGSSLLEKGGKLYVPTIALVTNLSVHFKWGRESSLVWVTELSSGKPVEGAEIEIADCKGKIYAKGKTLKDGTIKVAGLPRRKDIAGCSWKTYDNGLYVIANLGGDSSFLHSSWNRGIESWRYNLPYPNFPQARIAHTVLDRTLFRSGETVSMKHFIRKHSMKGFIAADLSSVPNYLVIRHDGTEETVSQPIKWSYPGSAESKWKIPKSAKLGTYSIHLAKNPEGDGVVQHLGEFRVEEFRLPILKASISSQQATWVDQSKIPVTLQASYLAGGSASNLPVKLRYRITPANFSPNGWENYSFSSMPIKTGRVDKKETEEESQSYTSIDFNLNKEGISNQTIDWKDRMTVASLQAEMEFRDPNGDVQSVSNRFALLPANQFVGLSSDSYSMNQEDVMVRAVVVDSKGIPQPGTDVSIQAFKEEEFTHRKRLVGGFYAYESYTDISSLGTICSGKTDSNGYFICKTNNFPTTGEVILEAKAKDGQGKLSYANQSLWISGKGDWWYSASDNDRMDILPDKANYEVGEKAKVQIRAPFSSYTALVTVEREGIIKSYIQDVDGKNPFVEIPIEKNFAPNVFISVLAVRGRVGDPKETAMVDLARPSFRLGIAEIKVGWKPHKLDVIVSSDKSEYQVRSKAKVKVSVTNASGGSVRTGGEIALAVVDEALLELYGNTTWDLLSAMMGRRGMEVDSYSAQMQVIGKRHFGRKAVAAGGGGGNQPTRELLDTLLYWNPKITLNAKGEAEIEVPIKDSLTSYRVVAIATTGVDSFGTGFSKFSSTQDILLFSGVPPMVRTGDRYIQEYTIKNNTKKDKKISAKLQSDGSNGKESFPEQTISIAAGDFKKIGWDVLIGDKEGDRISIIDLIDSGKKIDSLKITQDVQASIPIRITQGTIFQLDGSATQPIQLPKDALIGKGRVDVNMSSTIISSTDALQKYMEWYPFTCMEQQVSKAIVSENQSDRSRITKDLPGYMDGDGLVKYFPSTTWGDEILTAYILSITKEAGWNLPSSTMESMFVGLNRYLDGTLVRNRQYNFSDSTIRRLMVMESLSRYDRLSSDRLTSMNIDIKLLPTSSVLDLISILKRLPKNQDRVKLLSEAEGNLRARLNIQGKEMNIANTTGTLWWLMGSDDQDFARLLSYTLDTPSYSADMGRLAISFTSRMKDGRFANTLANSYGYLSLKKFAAIQEKDKLSGSTNVSLLEMKRLTDWKSQPKESYSIEFPMNQANDGDLKLDHQGTGKPWVSISTWSAVPLKKDWDNGMRVRKTIKALERKSFLKWSVGDIVHVKIEWQLDVPRTWIIITDPVPAGSTILGSGLGRDTSLGQEKIEGDYWASYQERSFSGFRSYYEYLPEGKYSLEYSFRLNQEGKFQLPPTRGEAMYSPDIFGETPNEDWIVLP